MKLHRLRVQSFAAIREMDIAFGPGLNVLYGPNEIGKSTLAEAIRLALLLPYNSNHHEAYVPWSGADSPRIDLVFETEEQRIWRVQKHFGKRGTALLQESRDGKDFEDVERARAVDARLREILRWGIPEPGGSGAPKGLPASFLATALLSTQADVSDVLKTSLSDDPTGSGKERIAEALEAVAQDPLFAELLREAQARRDEAYTDKGAKSRAQGSVFKIAADRVRETREEKEHLEKMVEESDAIERRLRELDDERARRDEERAAAEERLATAARLARQATDRAMAEEAVREARAEVLRIQSLDQRIAEAEEKVRQLAARKEQAGQALKDAQDEEAAAAEALAAAEGAAVERERARRAEALRAEQEAHDALRRCDLLEHGLDVRNAEQRATNAAALQAQWEKVSEERTAVAEQRAAIIVPPAGSLNALRKLETEWASARGALDVGLVVTVIPTAIVNLRIRKDGGPAEPEVIAQPVEIEADAEVDVDV
ncbi:MAG TPA: AAA family ATPase, partial [Thermoanaerobaculia bacterium]|nr:AAA family ATPase [Thermoanaerobaculia bacterium]